MAEGDATVSLAKALTHDGVAVPPNGYPLRVCKGVAQVALPVFLDDGSVAKDDGGDIIVKKWKKAAPNVVETWPQTGWRLL